MKFFAIRSAAVALILAFAAAAPAQSLADLARKEQERRKAIRTSGKVYTNDGLRPEPPSSGAAPAAPAPAAAVPSPATPPPPPGSTPSADAPGTQTPAVPAGAPRTEADWRKRVAAERDALSRAQIFAEALQSRINVLSADFVNRDDPVQRNTVAGERQKALSELDRVKQEIQQHQKALTTIQDEARRAGVPAGWVR